MCLKSSPYGLATMTKPILAPPLSTKKISGCVSHIKCGREKSGHRFEIFSMKKGPYRLVWPEKKKGTCPQYYKPWTIITCIINLSIQEKCSKKTFWRGIFPWHTRQTVSYPKTCFSSLICKPFRAADNCSLSFLTDWQTDGKYVYPRCEYVHQFCLFLKWSLHAAVHLTANWPTCFCMPPFPWEIIFFGRLVRKKTWWLC